MLPSHTVFLDTWKQGDPTTEFAHGSFSTPRVVAPRSSRAGPGPVGVPKSAKLPRICAAAVKHLSGRLRRPPGESCWPHLHRRNLDEPPLARDPQREFSCHRGGTRGPLHWLNLRRRAVFPLAMTSSGPAFSVALLQQSAVHGPSWTTA